MEHQQVVRQFLNSVYVVTAEDGQKIKGVLNERNFYPTLNYDSSCGKIPLTFEKFTYWFNKYFPFVRMFVTLKKSDRIGFVKYIGVDEIEFVFLFDFSASEIVYNVILPYEEFCLTTENEFLLLQREFNKRDLYWNKNICKVIPDRKLTLKGNEQIRLSRFGITLGIGILKEINAEGLIIMYVVKMIDAPLKYNFHEIVGHIDDFQIDRLTNSEREELNLYLKIKQMAWKGHLRRLEPYEGLRVGKGECYYYLDSCLQLKKKVDNYTKTDTMRFEIGNYFIENDIKNNNHIALTAYIQALRNLQILNLK